MRTFQRALNLSIEFISAQRGANRRDASMNRSNFPELPH
jgi:hypothetical protein